MPGLDRGIRHQRVWNRQENVFNGLRDASLNNRRAVLPDLDRRPDRQSCNSDRQRLRTNWAYDDRNRRVGAGLHGDGRRCSSPDLPTIRESLRRRDLLALKKRRTAQVFARDNKCALERRPRGTFAVNRNFGARDDVAHPNRRVTGLQGLIHDRSG